MTMGLEVWTARSARVDTDDIAQEQDIDVVFIEPLHVKKKR
jgi:hypothetical protein